jgi:hypothetical protein
MNQNNAQDTISKTPLTIATEYAYNDDGDTVMLTPDTLQRIIRFGVAVYRSRANIKARDFDAAEYPILSKAQAATVEDAVEALESGSVPMRNARQSIVKDGTAAHILRSVRTPKLPKDATPEVKVAIDARIAEVNAAIEAFKAHLGLVY